MNNIKEENKQTVLNLVKKSQRSLKEDVNLEYTTDEVLNILEITKEDFEDVMLLEMTVIYLNEEFEKDNFSELVNNIADLRYRESFYL